MNPQLKRLSNIAQKPSKKILGIMSGTSLDGIDLALCNMEGSGLSTKIKIEHFITLPFDDAIRNRMLDICSKSMVSTEAITLIHKEFGCYVADKINQQLSVWNIPNNEVDLIASHGQTIYHIAANGIHQSGATLQIGDADMIAQATGIITIGDFRQKHIAGGGAGAPLAVYGDYLLFHTKEKDQVLLNIGGISNFTFIPKGGNFSYVICTDVGPGNALMDAWVQQMMPGHRFDKDGQWAMNGKVNKGLLQNMLKEPFFEKSFPKTTGKEFFNLDFMQSALRESKIEEILLEDMMATLCELTVQSISTAIQQVNISKDRFSILISGGGIHHPLIMSRLKTIFGTNAIHTTDKYGIHPDAKEAVLFALLANECICGDATIFNNNAHYPALSMGKISLPQ